MYLTANNTCKGG